MRAICLRGVIALVAIAASTGCMRRGRSTDAAPATMRTVTVARIRNNNWLDIDVYAVLSGSRERIGTVRGFETQVFELPARIVALPGLRLHVDPVGSRQSYQTDAISVLPGQLIELVVQQQLNQSHYSVFTP